MKTSFHHTFIATIAIAWIGVLGLSEATGQSTVATTQEGDASGGTSVPRQRSVIFYLMDTCRNDRMTFKGYGRETTPFLKWLAERSVVFESCYSQAPWTKPSMASMLSSKYPASAAAHKMDYRLPDEVLTWPEVLQANDMYTAGFSANIVMGELLSNYAQGFDYFEESTDINQGDPIRFASGSAKKLNEYVFPWLESTEHWPMLLYMHSVDPHEEYEPEEEYLKQFADPSKHAKFQGDWQKLLKSRPPIPGLFVTQENFDRTKVDADSFINHGSNLYDADILANDEQIRRLWDALQEDGWAEDFIFVFTSDHGEEFYEHGGTSHGYSLYDEMTRVPLMIYAPGLLPGGKRIEAPVRSLDIYPTLCELLDFEVPDGLDGLSLLPLIQDEGAQEPRDVYSMRIEDPIMRTFKLDLGDMISLREGRWKCILNRENALVLPRPRIQLFDLENDPGMLHNVADQHPKIAKKLETKIHAFKEQYWVEQTTHERAEFDPEARKQLEALGYLGAENDSGVDLWKALESRDEQQILRSLEAGADPNKRDKVSGITPLTLAALVNDLDLAKALFEAGAKVDVRNRDGSTPLASAAFLGRVEMLKYLLDKGADPESKSTAGGSVLAATEAPWGVAEYVAGLLKIQVVQQEVEKGREKCAALLRAQIKEAFDPNSKLFEAIENGDASAVDQALNAGASLSEWDTQKGWTPLSMAVFLRKKEILALLIEKDADVNARNKDKSTPLHGAALLGYPAIAELLILSGADLAAKDGFGSTPLHTASFLGRVETAKVLLSLGGDKTLKNKDGQTALDTTETDWAITEFILKMLGLDLKREDVEKNRLKVAELLRD